MSRYVKGLIALWFLTVCLGFAFLCQDIKLSCDDDVSDAVVSDELIPDTKVLPVVSRSVALDAGPELKPDSSSEPVSCQEALSAMHELFPNVSAWDGFEANRNLTVSDFLEMLSDCHRYVIKSDDGFVYLLGDCSFMLQKEYNAFSSDLSREIDAGEFEYLLDRVMSFDLALSNEFKAIKLKH